MSSSYPYFIPVSPSADSTGFAHPPVVLSNSSGDPVELIEVQQAATPPPVPTGTGLNRWIETTTGIEYEWDAVLNRWVEVRPIILNGVAATTVTATGSVATLGTIASITNEFVLSAFCVTGSGIGSVVDYYDFFPAALRIGAGARVDFTGYTVNNQLFNESLTNVVERIDRQLITTASRSALFVIRANRLGNAANFGNSAFTLHMNRVRQASA